MSLRLSKSSSKPVDEKPFDEVETGYCKCTEPQLEYLVSYRCVWCTVCKKVVNRTFFVSLDQAIKIIEAVIFCKRIPPVPGRVPRADKTSFKEIPSKPVEAADASPSIKPI